MSARREARPEIAAETASGGDVELEGVVEAQLPSASRTR